MPLAHRKKRGNFLKPCPYLAPGKCENFLRTEKKMNGAPVAPADGGSKQNFISLGFLEFTEFTDVLNS
jgi:hypothetical protein